MTAPTPSPVTDETESSLQKGDRVIVSMRRRRLYLDNEDFWRGRIVGESRDGKCWGVRRDNYKCTTFYHKSFCRPESDATAATPQAAQGKGPSA